MVQAAHKAQKRMKGPERRAQILEIAAREFSRTGFEQTGMDDIAGACGISKPVLYQHFKSKDDLFTAAMADKVGELARAIRAAETEPDPRKRLVRMARETMVVLRDATILWPGTNPGREDHPLLERFRDERVLMETAIDRVVADLLPKGADKRTHARMIGVLGAFVAGAGQGTRRWVSEHPDAFTEAEQVEMVYLMTNGILDTVEAVLAAEVKKAK